MTGSGELGDETGDDRKLRTSPMSCRVVPCRAVPRSGSKPPATVANGRYQIEKKLGAGSDRSLHEANVNI